MQVLACNHKTTQGVGPHFDVHDAGAVVGACQVLQLQQRAPVVVLRHTVCDAKAGEAGINACTFGLQLSQRVCVGKARYSVCDWGAREGGKAVPQVAWSGSSKGMLHTPAICR